MLRLREWKVSPSLISGWGANTSNIKITGDLFLNDNNDVLYDIPQTLPISAIVDSGGYPELTLDLDNPFEIGDFVEIENTGSYNGIQLVRGITSQSITLETAYATDILGSYAQVKRTQILIWEQNEYNQRWENEDLIPSITPIIQAVIDANFIPPVPFPPIPDRFLLDEIRMFGGDNVATVFPGGIGTGEYLGWFLCDGNNGTLDLRSRFVLGLGPGQYTDTIGFEGGVSEVTLTGAESGTSAHGHSKGTLNITASGSHSHYSRATRAISDGGSDFKVAMVHHSDDGDGGRYVMTSSASTSYDGSHTHPSTNFAGAPGSSSEGSAEEPHTNIPPYTIIAFIQYKG